MKAKKNGAVMIELVVGVAIVLIVFALLFLVIRSVVDKGGDAGDAAVCKAKLEKAAALKIAGSTWFSGETDCKTRKTYVLFGEEVAGSGGEIVVKDKDELARVILNEMVYYCVEPRYGLDYVSDLGIGTDFYCSICSYIQINGVDYKGFEHFEKQLEKETAISGKISYKNYFESRDVGIIYTDLVKGKINLQGNELAVVYRLKKSRDGLLDLRQGASAFIGVMPLKDALKDCNLV